MSTARLATVSTYNEQVEQLKIDAQDGNDILASLITFNNNTYEHLWNVPASEMPLSSYEGYTPAGGTNIWDAMGYVMDRWEKETNTNDPDNFYIMTVISDGQHEDPHSKRKPESLHKEVTIKQETGRWTFSFLGCDKNYLEKFAKQTGIPLSNMGVWSNANNYMAASSAGTGVRQATNKYFMARKECKSVTANFYSDDNDKCADFAANIDSTAATTPPDPDLTEQIKTALSSADVVSSTVGDIKRGYSRGPSGLLHNYSPTRMAAPASFSSLDPVMSLIPTPEVLEAFKLNSTSERHLTNVFGNARKV